MNPCKTWLFAKVRIEASMIVIPLTSLLITDGEVWGVESLIGAAHRSGHRLFTVGVGAAVAEASEGAWPHKSPINA